jgi:hypothetical protein
VVLLHGFPARQDLDEIAGQLIERYATAVKTS